MTSLFARSSLLSARPASFRPLPPTLAGRRLIATGSPKSDSPADAGVDQSHTGRVRIGVSLAAAVTLAFIYFRNPYIEGEGKTPSTSSEDLAHALKSKQESQSAK